MSEECCSKDNAKGKGFFGKMLEKLDKKLEAKSKQSSCCGSDKKDSGSSCCS